MIALLLILIPLLGGLIAFFIKNEKTVRVWALCTSIILLTVSVLGLTVLNKDQSLQFNTYWLGSLGAGFSVKLDGLGQLLCLLTAVSYPLIIIATWRSVYSKSFNFFGLMLLAQAGMMGVFLAMDALLFYFFWELALIPMYFLCSQWGGVKKIPVTFKFFLYTFAGSVLMLTGILIIYSHTKDHSFALSSFYNVRLSGSTQTLLFWLLFIAFAVKMPVFPFHTWQPDTYEQSSTAITMVLSGVMVKMGVFGLLRWTLPVLPVASYGWGDVVTSLAVAGMIYASFLAIRQNDLKRLVAYSSIAHIGLMCAAVFASTKIGMQGVMVQMFSHGINIIGLWIIVELIERQLGTRKISELGGLAQKAPFMTVFLVIIALANIGLPLTNGFVGEFMMFSGIMGSTTTQYYFLFTAIAGVSIILAAIYMLNMIKNVFFGNPNSLTDTASDLNFNEKLVLVIIVFLILCAGIYPNTILNITQEITDSILMKSDITPYLNKE